MWFSGISLLLLTLAASLLLRMSLSRCLSRRTFLCAFFSCLDRSFALALISPYCVQISMHKFVFSLFSHHGCVNRVAILQCFRSRLVIQSPLVNDFYYVNVFSFVRT